MAAIEIPCLAIESFDGSELRWFMSDQTCQRKYETLAANPAHAKSTLSIFCVEVDDQAAPEIVEHVGKALMQTGGYTAVKRRFGTDMLFCGDKKMLYTTTSWQRIMEQKGELDPEFFEHLVEVSMDQQVAFSNLMSLYAGLPIGVECRHKTNQSWAFVCPNIPSPYTNAEWRVQYFDTLGMSGHDCYNSMVEAVESMVSTYPVVDAGALKRCSQTPKWTMGLAIQAEKALLDDGKIAFAEYIVRCSKIQSQYADNQECAVI